ncbi:hypothetical protein MMC27_003532 [Xylographa pallens]|nr:hypothetical protein [Xylographa pallens]
MVKKGKVEAITEVVPEPQTIEVLHEVGVNSMEPEQTPAESGKDKCRFAETRNVAVHDRPTSSPYTTHPYTLLIGSSRVKYTILEDYLRFVPKWSEKCNFRSDPLPIIDLTADVHEDAGHTLVHYLNTGTYQTITLPGKSGIGQKLADYKTSVLAYCVARNQGLPGLEILAKHHVTVSGERLPFFDLLDITAAIYGDLPAGEQWFVTFLKSTIDAAFKSDKDLFRRDAFLNRIGDNRSFNLVLVNSIVRNLAESNKTTSKSSAPVSRQSSRDRIRASDFQNTTVELVMPVVTENDHFTANKERLAAETKSILANEEPVATKEGPLFDNLRSTSVEKRGRSPGARSSFVNHPDTPLYQSEGISYGETARMQQLEAIPKDDRTSTDDGCAPLDLSSKNVKPKVKKSKKIIKKKTDWDFVPVPPAPEPIPVLEPEFGIVKAPAVTAEHGFGGWGSNAKMTWACGDDWVVHPPPVVEDPFIAEDVFIPAKKDKKKSKKVTASPSSLTPPIAPCSFTNEHLQTEGWKHCIPCRARVQQLGLQLKQDEALNETF